MTPARHPQKAGAGPEFYGVKGYEPELFAAPAAAAPDEAVPVEGTGVP